MEFVPESTGADEFRANRRDNGLSAGPESRPDFPNQHHDSTVNSERPSFGVEELDGCGGSSAARYRFSASAGEAVSTSNLLMLRSARLNSTPIRWTGPPRPGTCPRSAALFRCQRRPSAERSRPEKLNRREEAFEGRTVTVWGV